MKALFVTLSLALAFSAAAADPDPVKVAVTYRASDLATPAGIEALYLRIELAARERCVDPEQVVQIYARPQIASCIRKTVDYTVRQIGDARLTEYARPVRR